jgi:hypothetical protein
MDVVVPLRDPLTLARILRRRGEPRRPPQMVVGEESISIDYADVFDEPLVVPRSGVRVAAFDSEGRMRFRVHPHEQTFLWIHGRSSLKVVPRGTVPNVVLLFHSPVGPKRVAGILLAAIDPQQAEDALAPLRVTRPLMQEDVTAVNEQRGRRPRRRAALESGG